MDRPRVTIHSLTSLDGRLDGFAADVGLYYELAARIPHQAVLTGSGTMLAAAAAEKVDMSVDDTDDPLEPSAPGDGRPWLAVVDSRGRLTKLSWLRNQPYWRDVLIMCSAATPQRHIDRLRRWGVEHLVVGTERVDLAAALSVLAHEYGVEAVRVDAGGGLNGALLRAGLIDEISLVVAPYLVLSGLRRPHYVVEGLDDGDACRLELVGLVRLRDNHLWLRYAVMS